MAQAGPPPVGLQTLLVAKTPSSEQIRRLWQISCRVAKLQSEVTFNQWLKNTMPALVLQSGWQVLEPHLKSETSDEQAYIDRQWRQAEVRSPNFYRPRCELYDSATLIIPILENISELFRPCIPLTIASLNQLIEELNRKRDAVEQSRAALKRAVETKREQGDLETAMRAVHESRVALTRVLRNRRLELEPICISLTVLNNTKLQGGIRTHYAETDHHNPILLARGEPPNDHYLYFCEDFRRTERLIFSTYSTTLIDDIPVDIRTTAEHGHRFNDEHASYWLIRFLKKFVYLVDHHTPEVDAIDLAYLRARSERWDHWQTQGPYVAPPADGLPAFPAFPGFVGGPQPLPERPFWATWRRPIEDGNDNIRTLIFKQVLDTARAFHQRHGVFVDLGPWRQIGQIQDNIRFFDALYYGGVGGTVNLFSNARLHGTRAPLLQELYDVFTGKYLRAVQPFTEAARHHLWAPPGEGNPQGGAFFRRAQESAVEKGMSP
jgi:hypothetical protein